jgi:hypothetical protein
VRSAVVVRDDGWVKAERARGDAYDGVDVRDVVLVHDDDADVTARCGDEGHAITDALDEESHRERRGWL